MKKIILVLSVVLLFGFGSSCDWTWLLGQIVPEIEVLVDPQVKVCNNTTYYIEDIYIDTVLIQDSYLAPGDCTLSVSVYESAYPVVSFSNHDYPYEYYEQTAHAGVYYDCSYIIDIDYFDDIPYVTQI